jgi:16S rRNA (guanine527-N7)-methyltransferase
MSAGQARLNELLALAGMQELGAELIDKFHAYVSLILRWNARTNLTAVRDEDGILSRHLIESIMVARQLPSEITTLLDFGSGAGFPGIPIALCREEVQVTLAESQGKKAAFLREAVRTLGLTAQVHGGRAETLQPRFDCVTMRAVDRMSEAVAEAGHLIKPGGWLFLMTTADDLEPMKIAAGTGFSWRNPMPSPNGQSRLVLAGNLVS